MKESDMLVLCRFLFLVFFSLILKKYRLLAISSYEYNDPSVGIRESALLGFFESSGLYVVLSTFSNIVC